MHVDSEEPGHLRDVISRLRTRRWHSASRCLSQCRGRAGCVAVRCRYHNYRDPRCSSGARPDSGTHANAGTDSYANTRADAGTNSNANPGTNTDAYPPRRHRHRHRFRYPSIRFRCQAKPALYPERARISCFKSKTKSCTRRALLRTRKHRATPSTKGSISTSAAWRCPINESAPIR